MPTFSTQAAPADEEGSGYPDLLLVNGEVIPDSAAYYYNQSGNSKLYADLRNPESAHLVTRYRLRELAPHLGHLLLWLRSPVTDLHLSAIIHFEGDENPETSLRITYGVPIDEWAGPWSIADYDRAIGSALAAEPEMGLVLDEDPYSTGGSWDFLCALKDVETTAESVLEQWLPKAEKIIRNAREALTAELDRDTLVTWFEFPRHVSTACEQYLLYFVQFLRDLGIEAGANLKHEARQVLFSVTPAEGAKALDRIREALETYLRLPDSPGFAAQAAGYSDVAVQQLQANIYHLKGQLTIANAVLKARNAHIQALELSNFALQQIARDPAAGRGDASASSQQIGKRR